VLLKGAEASDWDGGGISAPNVIIDNDAPASEKYKMWYVGYNDTLGTGGIGYAYSSDGVNWTKYDNPNTTSAPFADSDPVINKWGYPGNWGPEGTWNDKWMSFPSVIKEDSVYRMWLKGKNNANLERIGYFYSIDGINWTQYRGNPVIMEGDTATDDFDEGGIDTPVVIKDGTTYKMWYAGLKDCDPCLIQIGYAESPAYSGSLAINKMRVSTDNRSGGMQTYFEFIPEGPGPLDFTELKVDGPDGFSHIFTDSDYWNSYGYQNPWYSVSGTLAPGTYTFTAKSNNGITASNSIEFNQSEIPVYGTGSSELDLQIRVGTTAYYHQSDIGTTTPTFRFKPAGGPDLYYRVQLFNYRGSSWTVWDSELIPGTDAKDGYIEIPVPANVLNSNSAYRCRVELFDTNDKWTAHNRSVSDTWDFYTGIKDASVTPDFIAYARFWSERSFLNGDRASFGFGIINLAPWNIESSDGDFSVLNEDFSILYNFNVNNNSINSPALDFYYWGSFSGIPANASSPGYTFMVKENFSGNSYFDSVIAPYVDVPTLPQVTRKDMLPDDNAYLENTTPTLSWISKGTNYKYRIFITTWTGHEAYVSNRQDGVAAGQTMSETIPYGILREHNPYVWWVEVFDTDLNSRTRSNRLTFMTGERLTCDGDFEPDGDVDGSDLAAYISNSTGIDLGDFAANFGKNDCLF
jgi:hypothetical protein